MQTNSKHLHYIVSDYMIYYTIHCITTKAHAVAFAEKVMSPTNTETINTELSSNLFYVLEMLGQTEIAVETMGKLREFFSNRVKEVSKNDLVKLMTNVDLTQEIDLVAATKCFGNLGNSVESDEAIQSLMDHFLHWAIRQMVAKALLLTPK